MMVVSPFPRITLVGGAMLHAKALMKPGTAPKSFATLTERTTHACRLSLFARNGELN